MSLSKQEMEESLSTQIVSLYDKDLKRELIKKRESRIDEAVGWEKGELSNPIKHPVDEAPGETDVYFLKPGKEAYEDDPNPNDMIPKVGNSYKDYSFEDSWSDIGNLSVIDYEHFELLLVVIYRNGYLLDHEYVDDEEKKLRYRPDEDVSRCIDAIDETFKDQFPESGLWGFLHFLDILGWNEDVKYHSEESQKGPRDYNMRRGDFNNGRINNFSSTIKVPYLLASFVNTVLEHSDEPHEIEFSEGLETAQQLTVGRGVCTATQTELEEWFSPIMYK